MSLFWKGRIKYTEIKEVKKTTALDMFGSVGGYLGLFVGVSLTTIIEFAEFVMDYVLDQRRRKRKDRRISSFNKEKENGRTDIRKDEQTDGATDLRTETLTKDEGRGTKEPL